MCGRYVLHGPKSRYREYFVTDSWPKFPDRFNIAPSSLAPVIHQAPDGRRLADPLRWGLVPHWAGDETIGARLNNARGETVAEKPSFRSAYQRRRCIVPASGFYEWQAVAGQRKQPWFIHLRGDMPMAMGGLWESWIGPAGEIVRTFCIVTTASNEVLAPIHDRMPVILRREDWPVWLSPDADPKRVATMIAAAPAESMEAWPVSRRVSNAREEGADLIEPIEV